LDSGASVHIFKSNIINKTSECRKSKAEIKGLGGTVLEATEEGSNQFVVNHVIFLKETANISISDLTKTWH